MSKRALLIMSFLFVFTFGGFIGELSASNAKNETKTELTDKRKKGKKKSSKRKNTKKKSSKKRSSGKKTSKKRGSGKKKSSSKKKYKGKKKSKRNKSRNKRTSNNSNRSYNSGTYTPPKSYQDYNGSTDLNSGNSREYKRSENSESKETFKKEPKKDGE